MKHERGMGTLMTVFSGVAALMCLLVGIQLFFLESQIGQAAAVDSTGSGQQFRLWQAEAHTGAIMSLGAGALIFLFGLRQLPSGAKVRNRRMWDDDSAVLQDDLESLSVRIFEVDDHDRSVEVESFEDVAGITESRPKIGAWEEPLDLESESGPVIDPTDTILQSIHEAAGPRSDHSPRESRNSFMKRLRRLGRRRK